MTQRRPTRRQIQQVNLGKSILLLLLGGLILWLWVAPQREPEQTLTLLPTTAATAAVEAPAEVATSAPTEAAVATPFVNIPNEMDAGTIILSGVAELPGAPVEILVDGALAGETAVNDQNTWTLALALTIPGTYEIATHIYDTREGATELFYEETLEVTVRPNFTPPSLNLTGNERLQDGQVTLSGQGEPDSFIEIVVNEELIGSAEVEANGRWAFPFAADEPGVYEIQLEMFDARGTLLAVSEPATLLIEPPMEAEVDLMGPSSEEAVLVAGETVTLTGQVVSDAVVELSLDDELLDTVVADGDGRWLWLFTLPSAGEYELVLRVLDDTGEMIASNMVMLAIEADEGEEVIDAPRPFTAAEPVVDEDAAEIVLSGTGEPDSQVVVTIADEPVGGVVIDQNGDWTLVVDLPPTSGEEVTIALENVSATGEVSLANEVLVLAGQTAGVTEAAEATATVETPVTATPEPTPTIGGLVNNPLQISYPSEGDVLDDVLIRLLGTGPARQQIEFLDNGVPVGRTTVPDSGIWRYSYGAESGTHALSVRLLGDAESETEPFVVTLNRPPINPACDDPEPGEDLGDRYIVGDCEWLLQITNRLGVDYEEVLALNPEIDNPNELFPGQVILLPARN